MSDFSVCKKVNISCSESASRLDIKEKRASEILHSHSSVSILSSDIRTYYVIEKGNMNRETTNPIHYNPYRAMKLFKEQPLGAVSCLRCHLY